MEYNDIDPLYEAERISLKRRNKRVKSAILPLKKESRKTNPLVSIETSLTQSSLGSVELSFGGKVEGRYSISKVASSLIPTDEIKAPNEVLSRVSLIRKSKGMG